MSSPSLDCLPVGPSVALLEKWKKREEKRPSLMPRFAAGVSFSPDYHNVNISRLRFNELQQSGKIPAK
jgi:hypothetical protein